LYVNNNKIGARRAQSICLINQRFNSPHKAGSFRITSHTCRVTSISNQSQVGVIWNVFQSSPKTVFILGGSNLS